MKHYRDSKWKLFRDEILELDGSSCCKCGRGSFDEVVLQVHHKKYIRGLMPWEYSYNDCETICKGCHAEIHGKIIPKSGWEYVTDEDLGDLCGECEYCGSSLRYLFHIYHENWGSLGVGTICCDTLTESDTASAQARQLKKREDRARRFLESPRWKIEEGIYRIKQKGFDVEIHKTHEGHKIVMNNIRGKQIFPKMTQARMKVFEVIENGKAEKYFKNKP